MEKIIQTTMDREMTEIAIRTITKKEAIDIMTIEDTINPITLPATMIAIGTIAKTIEIDTTTA